MLRILTCYVWSSCYLVFWPFPSHSSPTPPSGPGKMSGAIISFAVCSVSILSLRSLWGSGRSDINQARWHCRLLQACLTIGNTLSIISSWITTSAYGGISLSLLAVASCQIHCIHHVFCYLRVSSCSTQLSCRGMWRMDLAVLMSPGPLYCCRNSLGNPLPLHMCLEALIYSHEGTRGICKEPILFTPVFFISIWTPVHFPVPSRLMLEEVASKYINFPTTWIRICPLKVVLVPPAGSDASVRPWHAVKGFPLLSYPQ